MFSWHLRLGLPNSIPNNTPKRKKKWTLRLNGGFDANNNNNNNNNNNVMLECSALLKTTLTDIYRKVREIMSLV